MTAARVGSQTGRASSSRPGGALHCNELSAWSIAMKILVLLIVLLILASLGQALFYLVRDRGRGERTVRALTWRIALSIGLFLFLMAGFHFGFIPVRGS